MVFSLRQLYCQPDRPDSLPRLFIVSGSMFAAMLLILFWLNFFFHRKRKAYTGHYHDMLEREWRLDNDINHLLFYLAYVRGHYQKDPEEEPNQCCRDNKYLDAKKLAYKEVMDHFEIEREFREGYPYYLLPREQNTTDSEDIESVNEPDESGKTI